MYFFPDNRTLGGTVGISVGQAIWSSVNDVAYSTATSLLTYGVTFVP